MIEIEIKGYLDSVLDYPVYMERPTDLPDQYYIVEKTGSRMENHIKSATIVVQSIAQSMLSAITMNEAAINAMLYDDPAPGLLSLPKVTSVKLNADYNFTNTASKQYRYQAVFDVTHY